MDSSASTTAAWTAWAPAKAKRADEIPPSPRELAFGDAPDHPEECEEVESSAFAVVVVVVVVVPPICVRPFAAAGRSNLVRLLPRRPPSAGTKRASSIVARVHSGEEGVVVVSGRSVWSAC